ncbi:type II secretion system protein [Janthinobacterium sp. SUN206]|uniref:type IV pilus modification PilV family protein n=1 Tax=Janthinobacterium sp. SUN206 TaxID=3014787 RepID=UPI0027123381|nr:type II secretion system protein [Janthinobacterium sp. SUN206]MDO8065467.1 type II secretion system protein [Janthinobacterium sp. SUN206]
MSISQRRQRERGVTLIELVLFIVIVGLASAAILGVMSLTTKRSADPQLRKQALAIAESMLEEIQLARFTYCDPQDPAAETATSPAGCAIPEGPGEEANGAGRPFDNVNDYVSAYGTATEYKTDAQGNAWAASPTQNYTALVTITEQALNGLPATESLHIQVVVPYADQQIVLDGYRVRYAPNSIP